MLKFHRWLSVLFGVFLLWIATTGVMSQFAALQANGGFERETDVRGQRQAAALGEGVAPAASAHGDDGDEDAAQARPVAAPAAFVMTYRPKPAPNGARAWVGWLHHLHSGEEFGPAGVVISIFSGVAMMVFTISGLWLYLRMWGDRRVRNLTPRWFWQ